MTASPITATLRRLAIAIVALAAFALAPAALADQRVDSSVRGEIGALNQYWAGVFAAQHIVFHPVAGVVLYNDTSLTGITAVPRECDFLDGHADGRLILGPSNIEPNSFFCPGDDRIYIDSRLLAAQIVQFGSGATYWAVAHEYGHHVQHLLRWPDRYEVRYDDYAPVELQADCFSGVFFGSLVREGRFTADDVRTAENLIRTLGSDTPWHRSGSHGTGEQRVSWFKVGLPGNASTCAHVFSVS